MVDESVAEDACPTMAWGDAKSYVGTDVKKAWLRTLRSSTP